MVDLTELDYYIERPDAFMQDYIPHEINRLGLDVFLDYSIGALQANKVWPDGLRPIQTTSYIYVRAVTEIVHTIKTYVTDLSEQDKWYNKLLEQHRFNLEYEKDNPPVDYDKDKKENKTKSTKPKRTTTDKKSKKDNKPSAAEIKLMNRVAKLSSLSINFKK